MKESAIEIKSFTFAVRIVNLYRYLVEEKNEYVMSKQLMRSGTSIGANVAEAYRGVSDRDFVNKMSIALKEANESEYWIKLLHATGYLNDIQYESVKADCSEINKILIVIVKKTNERINQVQKKDS